MYSISKDHLMAMRAGIAVLLILVFVLFLKLMEEPKIPPGLTEFQRTLAEGTSTVATIIGSNGKLRPFDRKLSPLKSCGESKDTTFPASCRPKEGSALLFKNDVNLLVFGKDKDNVTDVILGTEDTTYYNYRRCPDGSCCC